MKKLKEKLLDLWFCAAFLSIGFFAYIMFHVVRGWTYCVYEKVVLIRILEFLVWLVAFAGSLYIAYYVFLKKGWHLKLVKKRMFKTKSSYAETMTK